MTHAVIYDRASTQRQKDNYSRVNAKEVGIRIAEQNGWTWDYIKEIGSGTTLTGRPKMLRILDRIAAGEIQVIIVQELDRLARPEDAVIYTTIRGTIMKYDVIIHTHSSRVDLNNDDDDFVADINMAVSKKERRRTLKRMERGIRARAESGRFAGGQAGTGYVIVNHDGISDFTIDTKEAKMVELIFDTLEVTGGNMSKAARQLNDAGHRGKNGKRFTQTSIRQIIGNKLYIGIFESSVTDKITHRPDLQIISTTQYERVHKLVKGRSGNGKELGRRGRYTFTGFVTCSNCGGTMVAGKQKDGRVFYQCMARRKFGQDVCLIGQTLSEHLILPPIIEFLTDFIQSQIDFHDSLNNAASQYGKTITEEVIEAAIQGELESVKAGKQRIIEAISLGVLNNEEAAVKMAELRDQEARLTIELSSIAEKTQMLENWQSALDSIKGKGDIAPILHYLAKEEPIVFRQLLGLVFEPNSLKMKTERIQGRQWHGVLVEYQLTQVMKANPVSFGIET